MVSGNATLCQNIKKVKIVQRKKEKMKNLRKRFWCYSQTKTRFYDMYLFWTNSNLELFKNLTERTLQEEIPILWGSNEKNVEFVDN